MWGCIITGRCFNPDNIQNPLCSYRMPDRGSKNEEGFFLWVCILWGVSESSQGSIYASILAQISHNSLFCK